MWNEEQEFERKWWGTCQNTYGEESKQLVYAKHMGLEATHDGNSPYSFDVKNKRIVDIGGGPASLLLKCRNLTHGLVVDPCKYPDWVYNRYLAAGLAYERKSGEDLDPAALGPFDEAWIYNVLQHVQDPAKIIMNARRMVSVVRIFEWVDIPAHEGHPHELKTKELFDMLGGSEKSPLLYMVGELNGEGTCHGRYLAGAFRGER